MSFAEVTQRLSCDSEKKVDLLFVVDDSVSMGAFRARWAENLPTFTDVLEREEIDASFRVAFTTSSVSGPGCGQGNDGRLLFESCRAAGSSLVDGPDLDGDAVDLSTICEASCPIEEFVETPMGVNGLNDSWRPWLERRGPFLNVAGGAREVATCAGQVPVGCPYEQPLEAKKMAIDRMHDADDPAFGFLRDDAIFLVVFVGDEDDCSIQDAEAFFSATETSPASTCWRVGSACTPNDGGTLDCRAITQPEGGPLYDVSRYVGVLELIEERKQQINPDQAVLVQLIAGVPSGYDQGFADLVFEPESADSVREIGIAPGCVDGSDETRLQAYPPVRLLEFAEQFRGPNQSGGERNAFSICSEDYTPVLSPVAAAIEDQLRPGCVEACVADSDAGTPGLQPECRVFQTSPEGRSEVPRCEGEELPDGSSTCYVLRAQDWRCARPSVRRSRLEPSDWSGPRPESATS